MSRTSAAAVSIHATSPGLMGPPVTAGPAGLNTTAATLTTANSKNGKAGKVRIRAAVGRTTSSVICQSSGTGSTDVFFSRADPIGLLHGHHEHAAVADLA